MMAEKAEAYWLIDLISSHQCKKEMNNERFRVWELKQLKNNVFRINATDGNKKKGQINTFPLVILRTIPQPFGLFMVA